MFFKKKEIDKNNKKRSLFIISVLVFLFLFTSLFFEPETVYAQVVSAPALEAQINAMSIQERNQNQAQYQKLVEQLAELKKAEATALRKEKWDKIKNNLLSSGSRALQTATRSALNKIAFDTATWIGSGGKGQKPLFVTENWRNYLYNIGDQAAGQFIEQVGRNNGLVDFNLCEPDFSVKMQIGLGLKQQMRPSAPTCTFKQMRDNWNKELNSPDFLSKFQVAFDPTQSDLGIALTLQTGMMEETEIQKNQAQLELAAKGGWKDATNIAGKLLTVPGDGARQLDALLGGFYGNFLKVTPDPLVDAANVFLNQLAITAFNKAMMKVAKNSPSVSSPYGGLADFNASPGGSGANDSLRQLLEPKFNTRGDYDIIASLSSCDKQNIYAPTTGCVIEEKFAAAIREKKTVGQAISEGSLNANWMFGFKISGSTTIEPKYYEGYPYRSMLILRKYRIIPAGWEEAAKALGEKMKTDSNSARDATLGKMAACFDPCDSYTGFGDGTITKNNDGTTTCAAPATPIWCKGLVDPNWVLKAPQNYCAKEGYGPEIMSDEIADSGKTRQISRSDNYCGDEQSCINEGEDGSCSAYGYCTTEKRTWNFGADKCEPKYNTCQTFSSKDGKTFSYLENTLDYGICDSNNAGCKKYTQSPSISNYNAVKDTITWPGANSIYFDAKAEACSQENEGCHEYIRTKSGLGTNLIINSGFEDDAVDNTASITSISGSEIKFGNWPLHQEGGANLQAKIINNVSDRSGKILHITMGSGDGGLYSYDHSAASYSSVSVFPEGFIMESGVAYTLSAWVKLVSGGDVKVGIGNNTTEFKTATLDKPEEKGVWKRIILTVNNDNNLAANELYIYGTGSAEFYIDDIQLEIGSQATAYKEYGDKSSNPFIYEKLAPSYLNCGGTTPPAKCERFAQTCQPADVGCDFYTSVSDGGKIPAKTTVGDECPAECDGFDSYIQLATNFASTTAQYFIPKLPAKTCSADAVGCDEFTNLDEVAKGGEGKEYYSYLRGCIKPDSSCAEFYTWEGSDESGYQLKVFSLQKDGSGEPVRTLVNGSADDSAVCSEKIYNLPATDLGYNPDCRQFYNRLGDVSYHLYTRTISCSDNCHSYRRTDDATAYMAIPGEGKACSANQAGCREYSGNAGSNIKNILGVNGDNFEDGLQGWNGGSPGEAIVVGEYSLKTDNKFASKKVGTLVRKGGSYILSFWAKTGTGEAEFSSIGFVKGANTEEFIVSFSSKKLDSEWKLYRFNLGSLGHDVDSSEELKIIANQNFYIDNIKLTEVVDRYYLIKDSWQTPPVCNQDVDHNPSPLYMLGCGQYQDRDNKTSYLHNFSQLCQKSAVGCELMIDTHNSIATSSPADNFTYAVYDKNKECNSADKGCERLGSPYKYGSEVVYGDVYLKNDPDKYKDILCESAAAGCTSWNNGAANFKDPGDTVCEWRKDKNSNNYNWYKKYVKRCGGVSAGAVCLTDSNCGDKKCVSYEADEPCNLDGDSAPKTIGYGGGGGRVYQPETGWAGVCPEAQSGCTEYIDPISKFSVDLANGKNVTLEANTLYILSGAGAKITCPNATLDKLNAKNGFDVAAKTKDINGKDIYVIDGNSVFFNFSISQTCKVEEGELKKAIVEYRLNENVSQGSCTSVDFEQGCILLNERKAGKNLAGLTYDANLTIDDGNGVQPKDGTTANNANRIIKVEPDRVCGQWLACRSYVKNADGKPVCFDVGLCDSLDANGNCDDFIANAGGVDYASASGYYASSTLPISKMSQEGDAVELSNGGFELAGKNGYPVGWSNESGSTWTENKFKVLSNAVDIKKELNGFPPEGNNILRVGPKAKAASEGLNLNSDIIYILTAYVDSRVSAVRRDNGYAEIYLSISSTTPPSTIPTKNSVRVATGASGYYSMVIKNPSPDDKIILYSEGDSGYVYFDDIKIRPALKTGTNKDGINEYVRQSCRLYPKQDSLSCLYTDNTGIQKGLSGYCLQYDRSPGDPNACLLWYPVDKVKGEGIEESAGYKGKYPLYYCMDATKGTKLKYKFGGDDKITLYIDGVEIRQTGTAKEYKTGITEVTKEDVNGKQITDGVFSSGKHVVVLRGYNAGDKAYMGASIESVNSAYMDRMVTSSDQKYGWSCAELGSFGYNIISRVLPVPNEIHKLSYNYGIADGKYFVWEYPPTSQEVPFEDTGELIWTKKQNPYSTIVCRTVIDIKPICDKLVQTVSSAGSNKVYQSRLSGGEENFPVAINKNLDGYPQAGDYNSDSLPYGTIVYPEPAANPYEWDTKDDDGVQPLYYSQDKNSFRMGQLYKNTNSVVASNSATNYYNGDLKNIFAQSYGAYKLTYGNCVKPDGTSLGACKTEQTCIGGSCVSLGRVGTGGILSTIKNISTCSEGSENYADECVTSTCGSGQKCVKNTTGKYTCGGLPNGMLCCAPSNSCVSGVCTDGSGSSCGVGNSDTVDTCAATGEYKCNSTVTTAGTGQDCCYGEGAICSKICGSDSNRAGGPCSTDAECTRKKCITEKAGSFCATNSDCTNNRCVGGDHPGVACTTSCPGDFHDCYLNKCVGGPRDTESCTADGECRGVSGTCTEYVGQCIDQGPAAGICSDTKPRCIGGKNPAGTICEIKSTNADEQGCSVGDKCVAIYRVINGKRCCASDGGTASCVEDTSDSEQHKCLGGVNNGKPCTAAEVGDCVDGTCEGAGQYVLDSSFINWTPSGLEAGIATAPIISNVLVNTASITKNGFASLKFNSQVNKNQLPLVEYDVDWGDGTITTLSGAEMRDRPNANDPHEVFHLYSYWDLKSKLPVCTVSYTYNCCNDSGECNVKPKVKIKDNWGWCNGDIQGVATNGSMLCSKWVSLAGQIVVKEQ